MSIVFNNLGVTDTISGSAVGIRSKVVAATTTAGTLATDFENGDTLDGVVLATNDRILIKNQVTATENGIYIVQASGAPSRSTDYDTGSSVSSTLLTVDEGTSNADTLWLCTNDVGSDVVGTDNLAFIQIGSGDISGPISSTDNAIVRWDGTGGNSIQDSGILIDDTNNLIFESGTFDTTLSVTTQTVGAPTITIPDLGGTSGDLVINNATQTLTNKTLISPRIVTNILDTNGNELFLLTATGSAVNELTYANAATGTNRSLAASGDDTNIGLDLITKGTGVINISSASATDTGTIRLLDDTGGEYGGITVPSTITTSYTLTLPDGVGTSGQFLRTDGNNPATLVWATAAGAGDVSGPGSSTDNAIVRWDGISGTAIQNSSVLLSDTDSISGLVNLGMSGDILDTNGNELINFVTTASAVNEIRIVNSATGIDAILGVSGEINRGLTIQDSNSNEMLQLNSITSAVNEISITNSITATNPTLSATGDDTNIGINLASKGTGTINISAGSSTTSGELRIEDNTGGEYVGITAAATTTSYTLTMPAAQGASGEVLQNNGAGVLSWVINDAGITSSIQSSTVDTTTTSTTYVTINTMTVTPASGTYLVMFSASGNLSNANATGLYGIHNNGTLTGHSERVISTAGGQTVGINEAFHSQSIETVTGVEAIDVRYQLDTGTFTVHERSLILIRLS